MSKKQEMKIEAHKPALVYETLDVLLVDQLLLSGEWYIDKDMSKIRKKYVLRRKTAHY